MTSCVTIKSLAKFAWALGLSASLACGVQGDLTDLELAEVDEAALDIPFVDGDVDFSEQVLPTHVGPDGEVAPAATPDEQLEKIYTLQDPSGSRSRQRGAIHLKFKQTNAQCSGSIVNNHIIVTAAHCLPKPNRNALHAVTITYQYPVDPASPCPNWPNCTPESVWDFDVVGGVDNRMFFYAHPNQDETSGIDPEWDVAVGATVQSFGLTSKHFVTLSPQVLADGNRLTVNAYGAPELAVQHQMNIDVDDAHPDYVEWEYAFQWQYICQGDSGGPGFLNSGYSDVMGRYWQAQAVVMKSVEPNANYNGISCGDFGKASNIRKKTAWIDSIVTFWSGQRCLPFTNLAGQEALWCWAT